MKSNAIVVRPGERVDLKEIDTRATGSITDKEMALERLEALRRKLSDLQENLYAEGRRSLLLVLQAMDTGGKDGAVKSLFTGVNPAGVKVVSFKAPSAEERAHDFLWRIHAAAPARGHIGVWNRSHYEDVLAVRVRKLVEPAVWKGRFERINDFEKMLAGEGTTILKFFLHISKDEQKKRLQARLDDSAKLWKFDLSDIEDRKLWSDYRKAYEDALQECSTPWAPWRIIPADHKWARNLALMETVVETLEAMDPKPPRSKIDPSSIVLE